MRFTDEDGVRRPRRCSHCNIVGHDQRKCPLRLAQVSEEKGRGLTVGSEDDRSDGDEEAEAEEILGEMESKQSMGSDKELASDNEIDAGFNMEAVVARREGYLSDNEDEVLGAEVLDLSLSQSYVDLQGLQQCSQRDSQGGF